MYMCKTKICVQFLWGIFKFSSIFFKKNIGPSKSADPNANKETSHFVPKALLPETFTGKQLQHKARNTEWKNRERGR